MNRKKFLQRLRTALFIIIGLVSVYFFLHSPIFDLNRIIVSGNNKVTEEEILAMSGLAPGVNIFEFDKEIAAKSIQVHPVIKQVDIKRHLLTEVSIEVVERQVWAVIPFNDWFLCIDDSGVCFDKLNHIPAEEDILIITLATMPEHVNLGQIIDPPATDMIRQVWQAIPAEQRQALSDFHYHNQEGTLNVYTFKGTEIRFGDLERLDEKIKMLSEVLELEKDMADKGIDSLEYVDLRFKGEPVVKTKD